MLLSGVHEHALFLGADSLGPREALLVGTENALVGAKVIIGFREILF